VALVPAVMNAKPNALTLGWAKNLMIGQSVVLFHMLGVGQLPHR